MRTLFADVRYGARLLRRSPSFTLISTVALAIGIGANLTILGLARELLLGAPAGLADPGRVARVFTNKFSATPLSDYEAYRDLSGSFSELAAFRVESASFRVDGPPEQLFGMTISGNYLTALGVNAALGRAIAANDDRPGAPAVVMLSDRSWRARFGADRSVIGRTLTINGRPTIVIGVTPAGFTGTHAPVVPDFWLPLAQSSRTPAPSVQVIGRLRGGVTLEQAEADLTRLANQRQPVAAGAAPRQMRVYTARVLTPELAIPVSIFAGVLLVVAGLVLLLACLNIANLLLARAADRGREIGLRASLGASRARVVRQLLTESLLLALVGGAGALVFAVIAGRTISALVASAPAPMPLALTFGVDWRLLAAGFGLTAVTTVTFGLVPALRASRSDLLPALKDGTTTTARRSRLRAVFMTAQIAISAALLVVAGLLLRGLNNAQTIDRGFATDGVVMASVDLDSAGYSTDLGIAFFDRLRERLERTPGVVAANVVDLVPLMLSNRADHMVPERDTSPAPGLSSVLVYRNAVSPGHFATLQIPLVAGRDFTTQDGIGSTPVAIVNETLARRLWPDGAPIGRRIRQWNGSQSFGPWVQVIGVARDSKYVTVGESPTPFLYQPYAQAYRPIGTMLVRSRGESSDAQASVRAAVEDLDRSLAVFGVATLASATDVSLLPLQIAAGLTTTLGGLALVLGSVGLYGVMACLVRQRTREIGIRAALGAPAWRIVRLITSDGLTWTVAGLALGLATAFGVAKLIAGFLHGIGPGDPITFAGITAVLTATVFIACYIPARRATRIDPLAALRDE